MKTEGKLRTIDNIGEKITVLNSVMEQGMIRASLDTNVGFYDQLPFSVESFDGKSIWLKPVEGGGGSLLSEYAGTSGRIGFRFRDSEGNNYSFFSSVRESSNGGSSGETLRINMPKFIEAYRRKLQRVNVDHSTARIRVSPQDMKIDTAGIINLPSELKRKLLRLNAKMSSRILDNYQIVKECYKDLKDYNIGGLTEVNMVSSFFSRNRDLDYITLSAFPDLNKKDKITKLENHFGRGGIAEKIISTMEREVRMTKHMVKNLRGAVYVDDTSNVDSFKRAYGAYFDLLRLSESQRGDNAKSKVFLSMVNSIASGKPVKNFWTGPIIVYNGTVGYFHLTDVPPNEVCFVDTVVKAYSNLLLKSQRFDITTQTKDLRLVNISPENLYFKTTNKRYELLKKGSVVNGDIILGKIDRPADSFSTPLSIVRVESLEDGAKGFGCEFSLEDMKNREKLEKFLY